VAHCRKQRRLSQAQLKAMGCSSGLLATQYASDGDRAQLCQLTDYTTAWGRKRQILTTKADSFLKDGGEGRT
jgi:hypothetical protein